MNLKSAAGLVCYVKDLEKTIEFYERLCFKFKTRESASATAYLNWWRLDFHQTGSADTPAWHVVTDWSSSSGSDPSSRPRPPARVSSGARRPIP